MTMNVGRTHRTVYLFTVVILTTNTIIFVKLYESCSQTGISITYTLLIEKHIMNHQGNFIKYNHRHRFVILHGGRYGQFRIQKHVVYIDK